MPPLRQHVLHTAVHVCVARPGGNPHDITQAEGGEQGDPLMPALFSLGQKAALQAVQQQLQPGEALYAFLDDVYTIPWHGHAPFSTCCHTICSTVHAYN